MIVCSFSFFGKQPLMGASNPGTVRSSPHYRTLYRRLFVMSTSSIPAMEPKFPCLSIRTLRTTHSCFVVGHYFGLRVTAYRAMACTMTAVPVRLCSILAEFAEFARGQGEGCEDIIAGKTKLANHLGLK